MMSCSVRAQASDTFFSKNGWVGSVLATEKSGVQACLSRTNLSDLLSFGLAQFRNGTWIAAFSKRVAFRETKRGIWS